MKKDFLPKLGVIINSIKAFNEEGKRRVEKKFLKLYEDLKKECLISSDSIYHQERIFGPNEAYEIARKFGKEQVDVIIILNSAFPNGHVFTTIASDPYLLKIPIILTSDLEQNLGNREWTINAWCGCIMNNFVAKQIERYVYLLGGDIGSKEYKEKLKKLLKIYNTISLLRKEFIGRFGDAPGGFHSATGNQLAYLMKFGVKVDTVDLTSVMYTYKTGIAKGYIKESKFDEKDIKETIKKMKLMVKTDVDDKCLEDGARLYHSFKAIIEANGYTSAVFRCWPEIQSEIIPITACLSITWLLTEGIVSSTSCESDWPTSVAQSIGTYLSGKPAACLDFVNYTGANEIVQLGHCGVGIAGCMAEDAKIAYHTVCRQSGTKMGPTLIGQFEYGIKTGINLIQTKQGKFKMLVFTGENSKETSKNMLYSAADIRVKDYKKLNELIIEHGFSHHLAVAFGDISEELEELCKYYDIEYISLK